MSKTEQSKNFPVVSFLVMLIAIYALVMGALYYFVYLPQSNELNEARQAASQFDQRESTLRTQIAGLESEVASLRRTIAALEAQLQQRDIELTTFRSTQQELVAIFQQEIADGQIQVEQIRDRLRVDLVNEILFNSGEVALNTEGMDVLRRVGEILNRTADKQIIVQGHTDNVAIGGRLAERFATNWELSAARAVNVVRFLQNEASVDPALLSAAAFSEYRPRSDNDSTESRQLNRRIEIVLAPIPEPLPVTPGAN
jgi:chemotaxis protein MotB